MTPTPNPSRSFTLPSSLESTADVILKSSDDCGEEEFRAHTSYLAAASGFFEQMFSDQEPSYPAVGVELPVIQVAECRHVLRTLLPCIYPGVKERPRSLKVLKGTLIAAEKYNIPSVIDSMRPHLIWPDFLHSNPLLVYSISRLLHFNVEQQMALDTLYKLDEDKILRLDMDGLPAADLAEVQRARRARGDLIVGKVKEKIFSPPKTASGSATYNRPSCPTCRKVPIWVYIWRKWLEIEVRRKPTTDAAFSFAFLEKARLMSPRCRCGPDPILWDAKSFEDLKKAVDTAITPTRAKAKNVPRR